MKTGKAIALGVGVGITAYMALVASMTLFGVEIGELDQFPRYVECLARLEGPEAGAQEKCQQLRSYFQGEYGDPWHVERLAAQLVAAADRLTTAAKNDADEIVAVWIMPIIRRLEMAADVVKDIFAY